MAKKKKKRKKKGKNPSFAETIMNQVLLLLSTVMTIMFTLAISFMLYKLASNLNFFNNAQPTKAKEKIYSMIDQMAEFNQPLTVEYINNIKQSVERDHALSIPTINLLQDYIVHLSTVSSHADPPFTNNITEQIQSLIKSEQEQEPFANLPDTERRLFKSLKNAVTNKDEAAINSNIDELSTAVYISNRNHKNAIRGSHVKANWGIAIGIAGIIVGISRGQFFSGLTTAFRIEPKKEPPMTDPEPTEPDQSK